MCTPDTVKYINRHYISHLHRSMTDITWYMIFSLVNKTSISRSSTVVYNSAPVSTSTLNRIYYSKSIFVHFKLSLFIFETFHRQINESNGNNTNIIIKKIYGSISLRIMSKWKFNFVVNSVCCLEFVDDWFYFDCIHRAYRLLLVFLWLSLPTLYRCTF